LYLTNIEARKYATHRGQPSPQHIVTPVIHRNLQPSMNVLRLSLIAALPLWLASCSTGIDLMGERQLESDEFYLSGAEPHTGDAAIDEARYGQWMEEVDEFNDADFDDPYAGNATGRSNSQLWNRYTPGWSNGLTSGFGTPYGYGNSFGYNAFNPLNTGFSSTYGHNNMAFMPGYDAWGNPIGGFGNTGYGFGNPYGISGMNGWGYDPWGGGYWGVPGNGYYGGFGYGYHPYYGNLGAYGNPFCGNLTNGTGSGVTIVPPRPRPSLGQFTGTSSGAGAGNGGQAENESGNWMGSHVTKPAVSRASGEAQSGSKRDQNRIIRAEEQRLSDKRYAAERAAIQRQRALRNSQRATAKAERQSAAGGRWSIERTDSGTSGDSDSTAPRQERTSPSLDRNTSTPSPSRSSTRPALQNNSRSSSPRPSGGRSGSSRGGRGG
jgi:hypothetical protein